MKRRSFFLVTIVLVLVCAACDKKLETARPTVQELSVKLYNTEGFISFTKHFLADFKSMADYYRQSGVQKNRGAFLSSLRDAGDDEVKLAAAFTAYSLSIDELANRKNRVDNDLLELFNREKILLRYSETEVWTVIRSAIDLGWKSSLPAWQDVRQDLLQGPHILKTNATGAVQQVNKLDGNEIWDCVKEAVGVGSASILGIAGLQKLASEGIQAAVVTLSKWLAKRAGWIGAAIMVIDFSSCLYHESID